MRKAEGAVGQPRQAVQDGSRDRVRARGEDARGRRRPRCDPLAGQAPPQLADEERDATCDLGAGPREGLVGVAAQRVAQHARDPRGRERSGQHDIGGRLGCQALEQQPARSRPGRLDDDCQGDRKPVEASGEVGEEAKRSLVGPLGIVDHKQDRCALGEVGHHPGQRVAQRVGDLVARCEPAPGEQRLGPGGGACEQRRALAGRGPGEAGLEELNDDAVRGPGLELGAAGAQDGDPCPPSALARRLEEARLSEAGVALHDHERAAAAARSLDRRAEPRKLELALDEPPSTGRGPFEHCRDRRLHERMRPRSPSVR